MAELVFRSNGIGGKITYAVEHGDVVVSTERHHGKWRNSTIRNRYVLTDDQARLKLEELVRMAAQGELPKYEPPKASPVDKNQKAMADAAAKSKE